MSVQGYLGQGNNSLKVATDPQLKDYSHASKTFLTNGYQYTPRLKFLFQVYFNINTAEIPQLQNMFGSDAISTISVLVKDAELPKFKIDTSIMNQYNRKRVVQTKLRYDPSRITFYDDQNDLIRNMWYSYYQYYYGDPSHQYAGVSTTSGTMGTLQTLANAFNYNTHDLYSNSLTSYDWGYMGETYHDGTNLAFSGTGGKPAFFRDITIYGLSQKKFAQWTLVNPLISNWNGDSYNYGEGNGIMTNQMTVEYETVKYYSGTIGAQTPSNSVPGFADPAHYDTTPSSITTAEGRGTTYSQGSMVSSTIGTTQDLTALAAGLGGLQNVLGAVQTGGTILNTLQNSQLSGQLAPYLQSALPGVALNGATPQTAQNALNSATGFFFPNFSKAALPTTGGTLP